jgi:membrane protein DedA with SNARE-associated domain
MLKVPNAAAQLMAGSLLGRGILYFKGRIRGDVLRHVFGPDDFLRKQIKAERGKAERR